MHILMLNEAEIQQALDPDALIEALAESFQALSSGQVVAPKRSEVAVPETGSLLTMPAYQPQHAITVKMVSVFHGNEQLGLPGHQALISLFDSQTGTPTAIMDGTYITALRTAGAAALSTRLLARSEARVLAIVGAGVQGRAHLQMLPRVRSFTEIRIVSQRLIHAEQLAATDPRAYAVATIEEAVRGSDVVCLCTSSATPIISPDWLAPGTHVTSVGYRPPQGELDPRIVAQGRLFVETRLAFEPPPAGCGELVGFAPEIGAEIGEVLLNQRPGRQTADEITVYKAMGHACEDLAAANLAYHYARQHALGQTVQL